jgi:thioredoxin-related protein
LEEICLVKTYRLALLSSLALAFCFLPSAQADSKWETNFKKAQDQAKAGNKLLLVDFTGSDWCIWCKRLDAEIFSKPEFQEYASKNLVLLEIDFPRAKQQSVAIKKQNMELAGHYEIEGFPTVVVLNGEGKEVGRLGYMPGGPSAFIAELEKLRKS